MLRQKQSIEETQRKFKEIGLAICDIMDHDYRSEVVELSKNHYTVRTIKTRRVL